MQHKDVKKGNVHVIHNYEFEDITKMNEFIGSEEDLNKVCLVLEPYGFYALKSINPSEWKALSTITINLEDYEVYTKDEINEMFQNRSEILKGEIDPTTETNPREKGALYVNFVTNDLFICNDNTKDANIFTSIKNGKIIAPERIFTFDTFTDNSATALLTLENNTNDSGNNASVNIVNMNYIDGIIGKALKAVDASSRITINASVRSISFFAKLPSTMPNTDYFFDCRKFGNSALAQLSGILKISSLSGAEIYQNGIKKVVGDQLILNEWTHITIILSSLSTGITLFNYQLDNYAWGIPNAEIDQIRCFNRVITSAEIQKLREEIL